MHDVRPEDEATDLLSALVAIPSVNPRDRAPGGHATGEGAIAQYVAERLRARGIEVRLDEVAPGRTNAVAVVPGRTSRTVVLETHTDTVEVEGMTVPPFAAQVRDGRLFGRGACDAKGSLAAYLLALEHLAETEPAVTVVLAAVADEEHHYRGVSAFLDRYYRDPADVVGAIVGEPTDLALGIAHKGVVRFTVHVEGRSGHSSRPADAQSAVVMATDLIGRVEAEPARSLRHPLLGEPTRTVVRIRGGEGPNLVPGHCEFDVDRRTLPGEDPYAVWRETVDELGGLHPGRVRSDEPFVVDHALDTAADSDVVVAMSRALAEHGCDPAPVGLGFCSDASKFSRHGIPAVVFGPGSIRDAHTAAESVPLAEVRAARDVLVQAVTNLAPGPA